MNILQKISPVLIGGFIAAVGIVSLSNATDVSAAYTKRCSTSGGGDTMAVSRSLSNSLYSYKVTFTEYTDGNGYKHEMVNLRAYGSGGLTEYDNPYNPTTFWTRTSSADFVGQFRIQKKGINTFYKSCRVDFG